MPISQRAAGVLLHPTSLPGRFGIGDMGDELLAFLDWVASAGNGSSTANRWLQHFDALGEKLAISPEARG